jgi:hypothetical protein
MELIAPPAILKSTRLTADDAQLNSMQLVAGEARLKTTIEKETEATEDVKTAITPGNGVYGDLEGTVNGINTDFTVPEGVYTKIKMVFVDYVPEPDFAEFNPAGGVVRIGYAPKTGASVIIMY